MKAMYYVGGGGKETRGNHKTWRKIEGSLADSYRSWSTFLVLPNLQAAIRALKKTRRNSHAQIDLRGRGRKPRALMGHGWRQF